MKKTALIYNPYLATLGGGERYMFSVAEVLRGDYEVTVGGTGIAAVSRLNARGLPSDFEMKEMTDRAFTASSGSYDLAVVVTNSVPPRTRASTSLLIVQFPFPERSLSKMPRRLVRKRLLSPYRPIVYSEYVRHWTARRWGVDADVISPPIERGLFEPEEKQKTILAVGRFFKAGHSKRQDVLIAAYLGLPSEVRSHWRLVLAGASADDRQSSAYLRSLKDQAGDARIEFAVNVAQDSLRQLLKESSIFWHAAGYGRRASRPDRAEHFGMATVEAMSWGSVPIVYDDGGQQEIVDDRVGLRWRTIDELIDDTVGLIANESHRIELARAASEESERYSSEKFAAALRDCLDRAIQRRARDSA